MSGISTSSGGDVKLDGDPNAFTGTNSFNINLPTSSLTTTTANDEFITKAIGDTIYGSGTGDALLAGGLTELNPQEFTGFNNFTKDTHFDENIDADDQIRMNGSSAQFRIAAFSMTSGDTAEGNGGNTLDQQNAGYYGNSIYQISGPVAVIIPAPNTCVFHQTGLTDIIRTEGKVQSRLAPTVGDDCVNLTYFNANAGGSFLGNRAYLTNASGSPAFPIIFGGNSYCSPASLYNNSTGYYTIPSSGKYFFSIRLNYVRTSSATPPYINIILTNPANNSLIRALTRIQSYSAAAPFGYIYLADTIELTAGDQVLWRFFATGPLSSFLTGTFESVITCQKVG